MKAHELLRSLNKVRRKEVGKAALDPQLKELSHAVENDPIFRRIITDKGLPSGVFSFSISVSTEKLTTTAQMLADVVAVDYQSYCESELVKLCSDQGSKIDIILIAKLYISHVINRGYSAEFVYDRARDVFYQHDIKRCTPGLLKKFFDCFPDTAGSFDVFFCGREGYAKFLSRQFGLQNYSSPDEIGSAKKGSIPDTFGEGVNKRIISVPKVPMKDPFSAARAAETLFSLSRSFLYLHPENVHAQVDAAAFVIDRKTKEVTRVTLDQGFVPRRASRKRNDVTNSINSLTRYVFSDSGTHQRSDEGRHRIVSSLNSASLAAKTSDHESRLLSIWSAFEALLPDPMKDGEGVVRIVHFSSLVTPCAVFDYLPSTFSECFRNCSNEFGKPFLDVVSDVGVGETEVEKFASIFIADQGAKKELCGTVASSPLMLMRFLRLEKLISNPKSACKYLETHENRVGWQINRIYRERNSIVHKAEASPFLRGLIENSYVYYRSVILSLEKIHSKYSVTHPDQGLELISALYSEYKEDLRRICELSKLTTAERNTKFVQHMFSGCLRA